MGIVGNMGFVKLHRRIRTTRVWKDHTRFHCYADLMMLATWSDNYPFEFRGVRLQLKHGQFATTYDWLADRWRRSKTWVHKFLHELERDSLIGLAPIHRRPVAPVAAGTRERTRVGTLITLLEPQTAETVCDAEPRSENALEHRNANMKVEANKEEAAALIANDREQTSAESVPDWTLAAIASIEEPLTQRIGIAIDIL